VVGYWRDCLVLVRDVVAKAGWLSQGSNIRVGRRGGWKDWRPPANRARSNLPSRTSTSTTGLHTLQDDKEEYCVITTIFSSFVYFVDGNSCLYLLEVR
jgi:hypothetical protein